MKRKYKLKRRAERQAETRDRIVQAAVDLHESVGPAATSISAIAHRAGVQRHTVYAHFPDEGTLFRACTLHWRGQHPFPDVGGLGLRDALVAIYGWYESVEHAFALFVRDAHLYPPFWAEREQMMAAVADRLAAPCGRRRLVRVAVGHAIEFESWRSLVRGQGLTNAQAADAMVAFVGCV